jgi:Methyltransferase domain
MYSPAPDAAKHATCRNCGGKGLKFITKNMPIATPDPYFLSGDMCVAVCGDCGFVGNVSPSVNADYIRYYTHNNKHYTRSGVLKQIDQAYFEDLLDLIGAKTALDWSQTDVLDWGSGALLFSELAKARGARSAYNYDMDSPYPDMPYGLIVSTHCFEHVYDFNSDFARIRSALGSDGLFLIASPDLRGYHDLYYGPYTCFDLEHINHFEITMLTTALVKAGFEIVSVREAERRVTQTLAYPEILVLARKSDHPAGIAGLASIRDEPETVLVQYLQRSERDLEAQLQFLEDRLSSYARDGVAISPGLYGVASYAFRLLKILADRGHPHFEWVADSDTRLKGRTLAEMSIMDGEDFSAWVEACNQSGKRAVAFICAVNGFRIETYLRERFADRIDVVMLPPNCQNREA